MDDHADPLPSEEGDDPLWCARSTWCGTIINVLSALSKESKGSGSVASVEVNHSALRLSMVEGTSLHGSAVLKTALFEEWSIAEEHQAAGRPLQFCVYLGQLLDCLKMFSGEESPDRPHTLHLDYRNAPRPCVSMRLVEGSGFCRQGNPPSLVLCPSTSRTDGPKSADA